MPENTYLTLEMNLCRVSYRVPFPLTGRRRTYHRFQRPQVLVFHPKRTKEPSESGSPVNFLTTANQIQLFQFLNIAF